VRAVRPSWVPGGRGRSSRGVYPVGGPPTRADATSEEPVGYRSWHARLLVAAGGRYRQEYLDEPSGRVIGSDGERSWVWHEQEPGPPVEVRHRPCSTRRRWRTFPGSRCLLAAGSARIRRRACGRCAAGRPGRWRKPSPGWPRAVSGPPSDSRRAVRAGRTSPRTTSNRRCHPPSRPYLRRRAARTQQFGGPRPGRHPERHQRPVPVRAQLREQLIEPLIGDLPRHPPHRLGPVPAGAPPGERLHRIAVRMRPPWPGGWRPWRARRPGRRPPSGRHRRTRGSPRIRRC
jgi:hypothetical protein